jgi:sugar transferase (PEP-CTERM/EpsH1 system associated)
MEPLLYLAHRLPFPPNKGDKVRSCNFLRHLAGRYRVFLGTFVDDRADLQHLEAVRRLCAEVHVELIAPWQRRARSATAFLSGEPLTLAYFRSRRLHDWVERTLAREGISRAVAFSSAMAQYVIARPGLHSVVDFVDMDSAKWADFAARRGWPASAIYRREARRLLEYEKAVAARASASIFVTEEESRRFLAEAPECAQRVFTIRNGVDSDYFSPHHELQSPFAGGEHAIVFTGAMDYWPNVDAVVWFAREVLPELRSRDAAVRFYVVGMNPDLAVRALAGDAATVVTGRVADVRPYLQHAKAVVAPLRVARGIQNKVLEAMAMAKPVIATPACASPLSLRVGEEIDVAQDAAAFASKVEAAMHPARAGRMGRLARERVLRDFAWPATFELLDELIERRSAPAVQAVAG